MSTATVSIGGLPHGGSWAREAELRPLRGADEAFLLELGDRLSAAQRVTALLGRCVVRLGPLRSPGADIVRRLRVGDREALLLHVRRLTFGDTMPCVLACPECGERLDLDLDVGELLVEPSAEEREWLERTVSGQRFRFRLPTGADQEAAAALALDDPDAAARQVVEACVEGQVDAALAAAFSRLVAELDPQAEIVLDLRCPACDAEFRSTFDAADYLFRELTARSRDLFAVVHLLALHYHWSEREILSLTADRRRLYLELLADAFPERVT
jgi:hypothetical protein